MEQADGLLPAVVLLGAGLLALLLARPLRINPLIGFLLVGVVIGDHGLAVLREGPTTHLLAELGVVFLLFDIGLHFSPSEAVERRRDILGLGPAQVLLCALAIGALVLAVGLEFPVAAIVTMSLALSSTAVVTRILAERKTHNCPLGRSATAVLIFQDLAAIFLLVFVASQNSAGQTSLAWAALDAAWKTVAAAVAALAVGRYAAAPIFRALALARSDEVFTGAALFIVLGTAWATASIGLSLTLGSFLAGMIIADTPYRHLIQIEAMPFRNLLMGFFFISVGMALDPAAIFASAHIILAGLAALLLLKTAGVFAAAKFNGWTNAGASQLAFLLAQGSEFALVVFAIPTVSEELGQEATNILVAVVALSLAVTPAWNAAGNALARRIAASAQPSSRLTGPATQPDEPIIVFGMNAAGRLAVDAMQRFEIPYRALETDPERFLQATADGYDVAFGDPANLRLADAIGVTHARALAISAPRFEISRSLTPVVRERYPNLGRFVAVSTEDDRARHEALGIRSVVSLGSPEGIEFATELLRFAGVDDAALAPWLESLRETLMVDEELRAAS